MKKFCKYGLTILIIWYSINTIIVYLFSQKYIDSKSDAALVLGAGSHDGELSPVFKERVNHAIDLYKKDSVRYIILTGGFGEGENISDSQAAKNYCIDNGVEEAFILIEEKSEYTFYNIVHSRGIIDSLDINSVLLVSDPYHMKRSIGMCKMMDINAQSSPTPTTMFRSKKSKTKFLFKEAFFYWGFQVYRPFRKIPDG